MKKNIEVSCDSDFFTKFKCPYCALEFKVENSFFIEEMDIEEVYCPYCGIANKLNDFMSEENLKEFQDELKNMAMKAAEEIILKTFEKAFKGNKGITVERGRKTFKPQKVDKAITPDDMYDVNIKCCNINIKIDSTRKEAYCIKCGEFNE